MIEVSFTLLNTATTVSAAMLKEGHCSLPLFYPWFRIDEETQAATHKILDLRRCKFHMPND